MMKKTSFTITLGLALLLGVQGCFFLDIGCKVKEMISQEGSQLIGEAEQAFEKAMDHIFDEDLSPLIDKAQAAIDAGIDKVDKDVNETINHITDSVQTIIHDAAVTASALASNITHDVEQIINQAASALIKVEDKFYQDASSLLAQLNQIIQKGQCMEAGGAKQIQDALYKLLKSLNPLYRLSSCWRGLGFKLTQSLEDLTEVELYNYQKQCTLLNKITPTTPIQGPGGILQTYAQGQLYAAEYYCIGMTAGAPAFQDVFNKEWLWWGVQYNAWKHIGIAADKRAAKQSETQWSLGQAIQPLKDDPCGTPVECYAQAIKALNEAESKILSLQTGLSDLNQTVAQNRQQVDATIKSLTSTVSKQGQSISTNAGAIESAKDSISQNTDSISSNSDKISGLTAYPCNCEDDTNKNGLCQDSGAVSVGFRYYCEDSSCKDSWTPVMDTDSGTGIRCCQLCLGTSAEAAQHALANPIPKSKTVNRSKN